MERVQARETLRGPIAVSLALRQRVITTIKINCGNYMNAYLVRQQQQRQVAKRMPSMLTTAVCVRPIGTQAIRFYGQNRSYQKREEYFCVFAAILLFVFLFRVSVCVFFPLFSFSFFFFVFWLANTKTCFFLLATLFWLCRFWNFLA